MEEWKTYRLKDFMEFNPKVSLKKNTLAKKITMDLLTPHSRDIHNWLVEPYSGGAKFKNGDTIMARITPCLENGKHAFISCLEENEIAYGSTEYFVFRGIPGISDNRFVYYLTHCDLFKSTAIKSMVGSSGRQRAQIEVLENLVMPLPSLEEQKRISDILSNIDDKIELNTRINHNLEEQMTSLFDELCVDIDGCIKAPLTAIADYVNGLAMQKFPVTGGEKGLPVLKIKELGQGFCDESSDRCTSGLKPDAIIHDGDIVFSWSGTLLVDMWCGGICGINQHLFKVQSNKYPKWFYYMWTKYHLENFIHIAKDKAVTMGHIKRGHLENAIVNIPSSEALVALNKIFEPMLEQILKIRLENSKLREERDLLLPRLMSGEITC